MTMNMEPVATWTSVDIALLFMMWAIMMAGMMLPSIIPVMLLIDKINATSKQQTNAYTPTLFFAFGYTIVWIIYSLAITLIQWWLHQLALLSPMMVSNNITFSGLILIIAGIYQFTPLKQQCLKLCRSPLSVISQELIPGKINAIKFGFKHGQFCVGCCWSLMAVLFVTGVMNLHWILLLTLMVIIEKSLPKGELFSKVFGVLLILLGCSYLI
ncbi:DUF2182 domain-containing protein [Thalassomonas sp. M1454]|uniref:DUF2182 domain-containing protein n=1 Tax=Thalassomonas sp. M1454 TaxID=2594477 RepID=UPI0011816561|nr:DUF2182 domain-containing protein [Thalassomonas sp. M1454]TRX53860.1 DUF2182 domain-containing protein [Thalassomonas sp. M1454]